jgi:hypothetical protein
MASTLLFTSTIVLSLVSSWMAQLLPFTMFSRAVQFGRDYHTILLSSIGIGGGVVVIVKPIHAPMPIMATKATKTGTAIT